MTTGELLVLKVPVASIWTLENGGNIRNLPGNSMIRTYKSLFKVACQIMEDDCVGLTNEPNCQCGRACDNGTITILFILSAIVQHSTFIYL